MSVLAVVAACLLAAGCRTEGHAGAMHRNVSLLRLIATPELFEGVTVQTQGYLVMTRRDSLLFLHREDFDRGLSFNAIALGVDDVFDAAHRAMSGEYVILVGKFQPPSSGGANVFSGTMTAIQALHRVPPMDERPGILPMDRGRQ